jgi:hypothetical protein
MTKLRMNPCINHNWRDSTISLMIPISGINLLIMKKLTWPIWIIVINEVLILFYNLFKKTVLLAVVCQIFLQLLLLSL